MKYARLIDARVGLVEVVFLNMTIRVNFKEMTSYQRNSTWDFSTPKWRPIRFNSETNRFDRFMEDFGEWEALEHNEAAAAEINTLFVQWLNRVMLADDADTTSKAERRALLASVEAGGNSARANNAVDKQADDSVADSSDVGRVPLRSSKGNFPVVPGERSWKIRPR